MPRSIGTQTAPPTVPGKHHCLARLCRSIWDTHPVSWVGAQQPQDTQDVAGGVDCRYSVFVILQVGRALGLRWGFPHGGRKVGHPGTHIKLQFKKFQMLGA